ncbi:MAG: UDP-N-acetylglucosamine 2-epimerase (non-hydrolyzing) [Burkholderiales bacterium]|nr:UDP-N-acetylglucosamine 2-epimerase (non-hydrolyzing) [Burkholderiales bacterium]
MTTQLKILIVAGARPNFMKVAPIIHEIRKRVENGHAGLEYRLVHTGQHYDQAMSDVFFDDLGIPAPGINLGVGSGSHAVQTANVMTSFEPVCEAERPSWVVVVGDINSTLACTLVCAKMGIKVAHVEAGLRSFDRGMPEEINRIVTDALADLLLTPSADGDVNLKREGIPESKIRLVGNVMIDALVANLAQARASELPHRLHVEPQGYVYVTLHRPSNVDDESSLRGIMRALDTLARRIPVVFPVHPRTRGMLERIGHESDGHSALRLIEPVGYHDSLWLTEHAKFILTDSGGIQEESTYLRTPCLTLRPNTERPVTIEVGTNRLTRLDRLASDVEDLMQDKPPRGRIPDYWDGRAAERIVDALLEHVGPSFH